MGERVERDPRGPAGSRKKGAALLIFLGGGGGLATIVFAGPLRPPGSAHAFIHHHRVERHCHSAPVGRVAPPCPRGRAGCLWADARGSRARAGAPLLAASKCFAMRGAFMGRRGGNRGSIPPQRHLALPKCHRTGAGGGRRPGRRPRKKGLSLSPSSAGRAPMRERENNMHYPSGRRLHPLPRPLPRRRNRIACVHAGWRRAAIAGPGPAHARRRGTLSVTRFLAPIFSLSPFLLTCSLLAKSRQVSSAATAPKARASRAKTKTARMVVVKEREGGRGRGAICQGG